MLNEFSEIYKRDLESLRKELDLFSNESDLWNNRDGISNCAGNLFLHLIGNLNHFIGAQMGNSGYVRERDKEFSEKNKSVEWIRNELLKLEQLVPDVIASKNNDWLNETFPLEFLGAKRSNHFMLMQLAAHLNYHLGQINYFRRIK